MRKRGLDWRWWGACALFAALLVAGVLLGDAGKVLAKAIRICLECIGMG